MDDEPKTITTVEEVKEVTSEKVAEIVVTKEEIRFTPRVVADTLMTLEEIKRIPPEHYPIIMYCDGGSLFGWLIRAIDRSAASHIQLLYDTDKIASQWFYYTTFNVDHLATYNCKLIWNPTWTPEQRKILIDAIKERLACGKWKTRYDVWGVLGEALNIGWMQSRTYDFCSEAVGRFLRMVDPEFDKWMQSSKTPTPKEINLYTKSHNPPYQIYGRYLVDDQ
jgi:hypothetical protein